MTTTTADGSPSAPPARPNIWYNRLTLIGGFIAIVALAMIVFLTLVELFSSQTHPYMGIITFILLPLFLWIGLIVAIVGLVRTRRRLQAGLPVETFAPVSPADFPKRRRALVLLAIGGTLFLMCSAFGSYQAYEVTDSVQFCGQTCHAVMKPEYTAYMDSPHARVSCVECHIGAGASWFVRSKISGSYQVYSVLFHKYHRPIETPVANLRPARETCEECHWPRKFYNSMLQGRSYYLTDNQNTPLHIDLLLRVGGGDPSHGSTAGIHAHMYLDRQIYYIATDRQRQIIPYVEERLPNGQIRVYRSTETPITEAQIRHSQKHLVDCIECHNRASHRFEPPDHTINAAIAQGLIDPALPDIREQAITALEKTYQTEDQALRSIRQSMQDYYRASQPQVFAAKGPLIEAAIAQTQHIYSTNYFPEMRTDWHSHPDNIGHMYADGCFRCHDNKHVSSDGKVITNNCNTCHTILSEKFAGKPMRVSLDGLAFQHPVDIGDAWKESKCTTCHAQKQ
ncbi:MAG TPA: NapC/NirT family cytochrome c [Chthonomonadaceae bacterium]|nr:NapC/NirT family cytochrome c [Chthonomonadaceae bacterium]